MLRITLLSLAFVALGNAFPSNDRVIGGSDAASGTYVWQVSLQEPYNDGYWHFCGGSLVSANYIVTAAHCYMDPSIVTVYMGSTQKFSGGDRHTITSFTAHPDYNSQRISDDYAVILLTEPADLSNSNIGLVALPATESTTVEYSGTGIVTGWGYYQYGPSVVDRLPDDLQMATLEILSDADCEDSWRVYYQPECMVCAGGSATAGICMGDSGGPFVTQLSGITTLIGAVSWVESNCDTSYPSVFAKIAGARDWISDNTGGL